MDRYRYIHRKIEDCHDTYNHSIHVFLHFSSNCFHLALAISHCSSLRFTGNCYMSKAVKKILIILANCSVNYVTKEFVFKIML